MASDPLQRAAKQWAHRTAISGSMGMQPAAVSAVKQLDLTKVSTGGSPMSGQEALAAIQSASTGHTVTQHAPSSSLLGLPGRAAKDVGQMGMGLGIGLVHLVEHPGRDLKGLVKAPGDTLKALQHPQGSGAGGELRAFAGSPIGKFVPGVSTAANLTTPAGRKQILQHPGFTAADLLPYSGHIVGSLAKTGALGDVAVEGSVAEAAAAGKITRTTLRAASRGVERITLGKIKPQASVQDLVNSMAISKQASMAAGRFNEFTRGVYATIGDRARAWDHHIEGALHGEQVGHDVWVKMRDAHTASAKGTGFPGEPGAAPKWSEEMKAFKHIFDNAPEHPHLLRELPREKANAIRAAYRADGTLAFHGWLVDNALGKIKTLADLNHEVMNAPPELAKQLEKQYKSYDPMEGELAHLKKRPEMAGTVDKLSGHVLPVDIHNLLYKQGGVWQGLMTGEWEPHSPLGKVLGKTTSAFKTSIFLRPQMILHVGIGSMIMALGEGGPDLLKPSTIQRGLQEMRDGNPLVMSKNWSHMSTDEAHGLLAIKTLSRIANTYENFQSKAMELTSGMSRALTYVTKHDAYINDFKKSSMAGTVTPEVEQAAKMAGADAIRAVFHNLDSFTPIERTVIKQVMPFYGFTKHLYEYATKFAEDHPFRLEVLSKISELETADNQNGIPEMIRSMLWLGNPDSSGKVSALNVGYLNPFRSFGNDLSISGFAASLNPAAQLFLQHLGVTKSGTPELYPTLTVDPKTGHLIAKNPSAGGLMGAVETFIPQLTTIDSMLGLNNRMKSLKLQNPSAYRAFLASQAGVPLPQMVNTPAEVAKHEVALFKVSQQDVSAYVKTGNFAHITGYNILPFQGHWVTPAQLRQWREAQKSQPGVNLKSTIKQPKKTLASFAPV